jgi:hypothetical protein
MENNFNPTTIPIKIQKAIGPSYKEDLRLMPSTGLCLNRRYGFPVLDAHVGI